MSEENMAWFHCGCCGSLFKSAGTAVEDRQCSECGRDSSPSVSALCESLPQQPVTPGNSNERSKGYSKKYARRPLMLKLMAAWILFLVLVLAGASRMLKSGATSRPAPAASAKEQPGSVSGEDVELIGKVSPLCNKTFADFLSTNTPEGRNQFVLDPIRNAARMARFYGMNPLAKLDARDLTGTGGAVVHLPGGPAIETRWSSSDGRKVDAWFREENGEWRLDWEHFTRYSDYPWALFLAGSGEPEGEFRLLARERMVAERAGLSRISLVLYAPRFGFPENPGAQSPEFLVDRAGRDGRLLEAAFALAKKGERSFAAKLPALNPEGMIPVRVKIRRIEDSMERRFELEQVVACHWLSLDDPGVTPAEDAGAGN